ncbi:MAG: hypothetical protein ABIH11_05365 [Candidatus Altiarchaeota archaeon]
MSDESDALFGAQFALEDIRELLRETAPGHKLSEVQKKKLAESLNRIMSELKKIEKLK